MSPYILLSVLIGGIYGTLFHVWQGKNLKDSLFYLVAAMLGFWFGQMGADFYGLTSFMIGPLHLLEASLGSWLVLLIARWLRG